MGQDFKFGPWPIRDSEIFYSSALSVGVVNLKPVVPGHVLVISRRNIPRFKDLSEEEVADLWISAQKVSKVVEQVYGADSVTFAIQDGASAGQTVPHVHIHVLPRRSGDFAKNDDVYDAIDESEKNLTKALDVERQPRTPDQMAEEAAVLRPFFA